MVQNNTIAERVSLPEIQVAGFSVKDFNVFDLNRMQKRISITRSINQKSQFKNGNKTKLFKSNV